VLRVVLPIPASTGWELRRTVAANSTWPANSSSAADSAYSACTTNSADTAGAADSSNSSGAANASGTTYSTDAAYSTCAAYTANTADISPTAPAACRQLRGTVADVCVAIEIVVVIDVDVVVPTPTTPTAPTTAPHRPHHHANAKRNRHSSGIISRGRIVDGRIGIDRRPVHHCRVIAGHVHHLRIGLFDNDDALVFDDLGFHFLLFVGLQVPFFLSLFAHPLNCSHDVALLRQKRIAKVCRPLDVVRQALHHIGHNSHRLNAWVPRLFRHSVGQSLILQGLVLLQKLLKLDEFERIGGSCEGLSQQPVWI
jgi:hypothetical protein